MNLVKFFVGAMMCVSLQSIVHAELTWDQKTVEISADTQSSTLTTHFRFENKGHDAVDISKVESSCGCTTATLQQKHFEPGQAGEITAIYTVGDHTGLQKKTIAVMIDGSSRPTILTLIVHIPEILSFKPSSVTWTHGEQNIPKSMDVELLQDVPLDKIVLQCSNLGFVAQIQSTQEGKKYRISVIPAKTDQALFATLIIRCSFGKVEKVFHAYASVQASTPD